MQTLHPPSDSDGVPSSPASHSPELRSVGARGNLVSRIRDILGYRQLLGNLVRKELKVKYKDSALGFAWSFFTPALRLVIFYLVFEKILRAGIPLFAVYLMSGLLVWNLWSESLAAATGSIVGNSVLVKKIWFPRETLPLASIGAGLFNFLLQSVVLVLALALFRHGVDPAALPLVPLALVTLVVLLTAVAILLSAVNVYIRDTQHFLDLIVMAWFWATPIVYKFTDVSNQLGDKTWLYLLNPMTPIVLAFQRAIYGAENDVHPPHGIGWYYQNLGIVAVGAIVLLLVSMAAFRRLEGNFAEEL